MNLHFNKNDRVEHIILGIKGTIEFATSGHLRVRWDDGKLGLLYFDDSVPNANLLQKLRTNAER